MGGSLRRCRSCQTTRRCSAGCPSATLPLIFGAARAAISKERCASSNSPSKKIVPAGREQRLTSCAGSARRLQTLMTKLRAAVIGSGFGGLAAAIRLQAAGIETVIFEKRDLAGGRAYVYRDSGFTFDAGPTVITAPECLRELFTLAGRSLDDYVELLPVTPFYPL